MLRIVDSPFLVFVVSFLAQWGAAYVGDLLRRTCTNVLVLTVLPVIVSIAFFLISDIDSPNKGVIRVAPYDLIAVSISTRQEPIP
jgi:hypothetical protein